MDELRYAIALCAIKGVGSNIARQLIERFGSAQAVFAADTDTLLSVPHIGPSLVNALADGRHLDRAEREIRFIEEHHIRPLLYGSRDYPHRLLECPDAPLLLFELGQHVTERRRVVSIVGTRQCSQYGRDLTTAFVSDLHDHEPDLTIVSGLALGIDITAHRAALQCRVPTVAVVAHGLDRIYPAQHRDDARRIVAEGGTIITEYTTGTEPERGNFLSRNRIIAGLADAVLVAESKDRGGSLVTAAIALDYNRDVFAFPGRVGDSRSQGCNRLIRLNRAGLITCAQDFIEAVNWSTPNAGTRSIQHTIPFEEEHLSSNARLIIDTLRDRGDMLLSQLSDATSLDHTTIYEELLDLEMDGKIRSTPGGLYQLR